MWEFFVSYGYSLFMKVIKCFIVRSKRRAWLAPSLVYDQSVAKGIGSDVWCVILSRLRELSTHAY